MRIFTYIIILFASLVSADESFRWIDGNGNTIPEDDTRKSHNGFGGWLLITPDSDWQNEWKSPANKIPNFAVTEQVKKGNKIYILVLYSNPLPDDSGMIDLGCDVKVTRPDGSISIDAAGLDCAQAEASENPYHTSMTNLGITYTAEEDDLIGQWQVDVNILERIRQAQVSLKASFTVLE